MLLTGKKCLEWVFFISLVCSGTAWAITSEEAKVQHQYEAWCASLSTAHGDAHKVAKFYAPGAILLPTLSPDILFNRQNGLDKYFSYLTAHKDFKCTPERLVTRIMGDTAINSGTYQFSYQMYGSHIRTIPARFTFVYQKHDGEWMIVEHHSSVLPE
jgi:hypothetical protein